MTNPIPDSETKICEITAHNIRTLRKARGLSQKDLADMCDVSRSMITNVELGNQRPTLHFTITAAKILDVNISWLVSSELSIRTEIFQRVV